MLDAPSSDGGRPLVALKHGRQAVLLWLCLLAAPAWAHKDTYLSLAPDGRIPELPQSYAATRVEIAFAKRDKGGLSQLSFATADRKTVVKDCVLALSRAGNWRRTSLAGSWYHSEELMPHYVSIQLQASPDMSRWSDSNISFLFSLRDARLLRVMKFVKVPGEDAATLEMFEIVNGCPVSRTVGSGTPRPGR